MGTRAILRVFALVMPVAACHAELPVALHEVEVRLVAQDRSWHASYAMADVQGQRVDVQTGREVHVPLGASVHFTLTSPDFISAFTVADLDLRQFAAPDLPSRINFFADRVGRYELRGDELCGRPHTDRARGWLVIDNPDAFQHWVRTRARETS